MPEWYKERYVEVTQGVQGWWKAIDMPMYTQYIYLEKLESDPYMPMQDYLD